MNIIKITLISLALVFVSTFTNAVSVSGNAAIQTDYVWRGMTQNSGDTSVNVGLDADLGSGFYVGTWAATVDFGNGHTLEHDYYGGYAFEMGGIGIDIGAIQVTYNGTTDVDFSENYVALSLPMNIGLHYSEGDELGDYMEISYSRDVGDGSLAISYGDMDSSAGNADGGSNTTIGYSMAAGDFTVDISYSDFSGDTNANGTMADQDALVLTLSM
tara:strand:- start:601 stop:1245 length:645 start_codon:yes stop_codon:yes gene_type:complete